MKIINITLLLLICTTQLFSNDINCHSHNYMRFDILNQDGSGPSYILTTKELKYNSPGGATNSILQSNQIIVDSLGYNFIRTFTYDYQRKLSDKSNKKNNIDNCVNTGSLLMFHEVIDCKDYDMLEESNDNNIKAFFEELKLYFKQKHYKNSNLDEEISSIIKTLK